MESIRRESSLVQPECKDVFDAMDDGLVHIGHGGIIVDHNAEFTQILGIGKTRVAGQDFFEFLGKRLGKENLATIHSLFEGSAENRRKARLVFKIGENFIELRCYCTKEKDKGICLLRDITENIKVEKKLTESENRYRTFIDSSLDGIFLKDSNHRFVLCNKVFCALRGKKEEDILGHNDVDLSGSELARQYRISDLKVLERKEVILDEEERDGRTFLVTKFPVSFEDGSTGIGGYIRDISLQRKAEAETKTLLAKIEEERMRLDQVVNNSFDEIWFSDARGTFTLANPAACKNFSLPKGENLDMQGFISSMKVLAPDGTLRPLEDAPPLRALRGETVKNQEEIVRLPQDGSLRYREVSSSPVYDKDNRIQGCVSVVRDITEKKIAEREQEKNEDRLRRSVKIFQHRSSSVQEFLDFALEEAIQMTSSKLGYIYHYDEASRQFILNTWSKNVMPECSVENPPRTYKLEKTGFWGEVVRQRKPMIANDFHVKDPLKKGYPGGHVQIRKFMSFPVFKGNTIIAVVGLGNKEEDYTNFEVLQCSQLMESIWQVIDRISAENELQAVNEHLDKLVQKRTEQLSDAIQEIESFSYTVSHDLRAPIRRISSFHELILKDNENRFSGQSAAYFERIRANILHMNNLTDDILKLTKVTRAEINAEDVNLSAIATNCIKDLMNDEPERKVAVDIEPGIVVFADKALMELVMTNLIGNAWKYSSIREKTKIKIARFEDKKLGSGISIKDNGIGFCPSYKERIFEAFQRLHSENEYPGTGIGLTTVAKIINRHGGRVWADSVEDKGSTFFFTLPYKPDLKV